MYMYFFVFLLLYIYIHTYIHTYTCTYYDSGQEAEALREYGFMFILFATSEKQRFQLVE
jgi:hypothetical protein